MDCRNTTSYDEAVNIDFDPFWSPEGRAAAARHGVSLAEVVAVIEANTTIYLVMPDTVWFVGTTASQLITVQCDRRHRTVTIYDITNVRPASDSEAEAWRSKQP